MKAIIKYLFVLVIFYHPRIVDAQERDSLNIINSEFITDQLENIASSTDLSIDFSDLMEEYIFYSKNPISINTSDRNKLLELRIVNENQLSAIEIYQNKYGNIHSKYELAAVDGFDQQVVERILPFVSFSESASSSDQLKLKYAFKYGRHQLLLRYSQIVEPSAAYLVSKDSAAYYPGSVYLGSPQKYYARYSFDFNKRVRFGFTWDKDAGELIFRNGLSDTVSKMIGNKLNFISDFFSAHLFLHKLGFVKKIIIGDYHLEFGQGMTMWSGLSFGKSSESTQIKKYGRGISVNTSVNENRFLRGGAITLGFKKFEFTAFYSKNSVDGNLVLIDSLNNNGVTGIVETGNHRTINELLDKDAIKIQLIGANINVKLRQLSLGFTAIQSELDIDFIPNNEIYKKYYFKGNRLTNFGLDFDLSLNKLKFFGELSTTDRMELAGIIGTNIFLSDRFLITISYRNFSKEYFSFYNNPFREGSVGRNEKGYYFGLKVYLANRVSLNAYADFFEFPWLRYNTSSPTKGNEFLIQLNYAATQNMNIYFRVKLDNKEENFRDDYDFLSKTIEVNRQSFRLNISYSVFGYLFFKNRIETVVYNKNGLSESGYLFYQDILYRPNNLPLAISFRYAIFSTDSWNSKIYAYENDILYAFSVPAYYDKGQRAYLLIKYKLIKNIDLWFRISRTMFRDKKSIGSGADEILSNHKTEIKLQAKIKL